MKKFLIIALTFTSLLITGCGSKPVEEEKSIAVTVQAAKNQGIENANIFSGTTKVKDKVSVTTEMSGVIEEMYVNLGDKVTAGQPLLRLKGTDTENSIKSAEAALNSAKAAYEDSNITVENAQNQLDSSLNNAKIAYDKAQAGYEEVQRQFSNTEQLYQAGAISENDYKQAKALKRNVESDYEYSYKYKPSIYKFNIQGKILNFNETEKLINDDDLLTSLVENPDEKELKKLVKKIKRKINDDSVVAITILDYSQENYNDDAFSLLIFNPKESVKNLK